QLVFVKGDSMGILKEYITKHNVLNDVPDDAEILFEDDDEKEGEFRGEVTEDVEKGVLHRKKDVIRPYVSFIKHASYVTNVKPPTLAAYTGVLPLIAKICQPENWKKKKASLEEKSQEKREFFTGRKM
nr:hypothetical protein [Tanacetum cinerariifolium]